MHARGLHQLHVTLLAVPCMICARLRDEQNALATHSRAWPHAAWGGAQQYAPCQHTLPLRTGIASTLFSVQALLLFANGCELLSVLV